jgi:hypothetical protein
MHSVLIQVKPPDARTASDGQRNWRFQLSELTSSLAWRKADIRQLGDYAWLIALDRDLPSFASVVHLCQQAGFAYETLFFGEEPKWLAFEPE